MWVILLNHAGWDCFKTPILQEILRIQNLLRVEHCAFLEVIHFYPTSWMCKKNKLQFRTVQQNPKSFLWMQDWGWTGFLLSICGIWLFLCQETRFRLMKDRGDLLSLTRVTDLKGRSMCWIILIVFPQTSILLIRKLCCMCLKTTKQWSRWS